MPWNSPISSVESNAICICTELHNFHNQFSNIASHSQTSHLLSCQPGASSPSVPQPHLAVDTNPRSVSGLLTLDRDRIICYVALSVYLFSLSRHPQASPPAAIFSTASPVYAESCSTGWSRTTSYLPIHQVDGHLGCSAV